MKSKSEQEPKQGQAKRRKPAEEELAASAARPELAASAAKDGAAPAPGIDEIITISRDSGKPKLELKKTEDAAAPREEARPEPKADGQQKERAFRLPKKLESKIQMRKPKAGMLKEAVPQERPIVKKQEQAKNKPFNESAPEPRPAAPSPAPLSDTKSALAEAALFLSPKPLMLDELAKIMGVNSLGYVKETLERLSKDYEGSGIEVVNSAAGWEMQVKPQYLSSVAHLAPYADLSEGPKRALALILFKEPLKQSDLIKMQGNKVYDYLKTLDKLGMIRREPCGRTKKLTLTKEFERYFGEEKEAVKAMLAEELAMQPSGAPAQPATQPKRKFDVKAELKKMDIELEDE